MKKKLLTVLLIMIGITLSGCEKTETDLNTKLSETITMDDSGAKLVCTTDIDHTEYKYTLGSKYIVFADKDGKVTKIISSEIINSTDENKLKEFDCYFDGILYSIVLNSVFFIAYMVINSIIFKGLYLRDAIVYQFFIGVIMGIAYTEYHIKNIARKCEESLIKNRFIRSFLYYVPYVTLAVMTFPAVVQATQSPIAGAVALIAGIAAACAPTRCAAAIVGLRKVALRCSSLIIASSSSEALMEETPRETISIPRRLPHF